jgi:L-alanine-DL-glutamate epimerase-like enolase superfamily enzyme
MDGAPQVDKDGYMNLPQGPGWGVSINKAMLE